MKQSFNLGFFACLVVACLGSIDCFAAAKSTKKQAALQFGTKVRTKVEASGIYDQDCYDKYYSCMDQFCISDNELGGSCSCSNDITKYEQALDDIKKMVAEAERISLEEVEKVKAGANADIIFKGTRAYDDKGNVVANKATKDKKEAKTNMWSSFYGEEDDEESTDISSLRGEELYDAANELCVQQIESDCKKDIDLLTQIYARQITSDCKGLANSIEQKKQEAKSQLAKANADVRSALKESLEESNKYDRGTCMVEYRNCMRSEDACGSDWEQCVFTIAEENMQNNEAKSTARTKVETKITYDITPSTMERLEAKRFICEKVLDKCVAVRDYVWNDFLRDIAPTIRTAENQIESKKRQSCLKDISDCIQKACKDDIVGKGEATMDACLARPDMARSFCKIQIDPCERMEPQIFAYVKDKLAAMRVDACTKEVKDCITAEDRCGADYSNCIGMDFDYVHDICPLDKLVVCKQTNPDFKMSDLDSMLMGLFLNIDNKTLEDCENLAEKKMLEICGSTTDCNVLAADESVGAGSVRLQKDGDIYRVTGMISFGNIKLAGIGDEKRGFKPGEIVIEDYMKELENNNEGVPNAKAIIDTIEHELKNISGTINRTISLIESDQRIQYCINGRDLSQIKGGKKGKNMTKARFPNLLYQYRTMIALSALRQAQDNYNKKVEEKIAEASKNASVDIAQYLCQKMADVGKGFSNADKVTPTQALTPPYAISYAVGRGVTDAELKAMSGSSTMSSQSKMSEGSGMKNGSGTMTERIATFDRESRTCKICTTITKQECDKSWKVSFSPFGSNGGSKTNKCKIDVEDQRCEESQM